MMILFAASEVAPFASTGALGEVLAVLPRLVSEMGHDVVVVLPGYPALMEDAIPLDVRFSLPVGDSLQPVTVYERSQPDGPQVLLIHNEALFGRPGLYGDAFEPYKDNALRFIFFSRAVVELAKRLEPSPQVLHLHDWQTALVPALVAEQQLPFHTVLSLHNVAYQGSFAMAEFACTNLPGRWLTHDGFEFYGSMNLLKGGILTADALTTVSDVYRNQILTPAGGSGLHPLLTNRANDLHTVPSGVDLDRWNPENAEGEYAPFSAHQPEGKLVCRAALLAELELAPNPSAPVFVMLGRLADKKGYDLLFPLLPKLLSADARLIIAGDQDPSLHKDLLAACRQHPGKMTFVASSGSDFTKHLFAGADILLVPSHFDPLSVAPLNAMRFGTVPVALANGGLLEHFSDFDPATGQGNAILFAHDTSEAFWDAIVRAITLFGKSATWKIPMTNAMNARFPWTRAAETLDRLYRKLVERGL